MADVVPPILLLRLTCNRCICIVLVSRRRTGREGLSLDAPELLTANATPPPAKPRKRDRSRDLRRSHGKVKLLTLDRLDRRTAAAARAIQLVDAISNDLGGGDRLSEGTRMLIQRAAVLNCFIESCEVRWLASESIELGDYLAAINCQRRC